MGRGERGLDLMPPPAILCPSPLVAVPEVGTIIDDV